MKAFDEGLWGLAMDMGQTLIVYCSMGLYFDHSRNLSYGSFDILLLVVFKLVFTEMGLFKMFQSYVKEA